MKIILSRKGFDSENGGCASPIFPDGTMISLPIPDASGVPYDRLKYKDKSYWQIWKELNDSGADERKRAHLDPDIREIARIDKIQNWNPIFGQCGAAQTHLSNEGVCKGDVFLFFGWFRNVELINGRIVYVKESPDRHIIYGYLQVGKIVTGEDRHNYDWHPHAEDYKVKNNTMYVASKSLIVDGMDTGRPGAGVFDFSDKLVLTKKGYSRTRWELPEFFKDVRISQHSKDSFKDGYFRSNSRGQEFVISEDERVTKWAQNIIYGN